ncbi:restriction endonuclease subunit S [Streptomyces sp. NPDC002138]|uniref:restriction endonuclease subunit S n=1 Tax=Streptomyces sp. NPDC002138 TaxID=3154410 RepID=UPI0033343502
MSVSYASRWGTRPLKWGALKIGSGKTPGGGSENYVSAGVIFLRSQNVHFGGLRLDDVAYIDSATHEEMRNTRVEPGDVLLNITGASLGRVAWAPDVLGEANVNQHVCIIRPTVEFDSRYLAYALGSRPAQEQIRELQVGGNREGLNFEQVGNLNLPSPQIDEQCRIADFLDAETARIGGLMELRKEQSRLWRERNQSFLHAQFVGGSSNCGRSTWLGSLPHGWKAPTIGRIARFAMGTTFPHEYQGLSEGDFPFIKVSDFQLADEVGNLGTAENWITRDTARRLGARIVPSGSILYARVGAALLLNRRRVTTRPAIIDDNVRAISFADGEPHYWRAVLSLLDMGQLANPGPVPSIGEGQVASVRVPTPPMDKQLAIAELVQSNQRNLHHVNAAIECQMGLLAERRQALITAAVTGQFDVSTASGRNVTEGITA